jgi:hypothetical protein
MPTKGVGITIMPAKRGFLKSSWTLMCIPLLWELPPRAYVPSYIINCICNILYRMDKKKMSKFQLQYLRNYYYWPKFLTLLLHDDIFIHVIPCKLYDCSFTNIPTASKTKHEVKNCNLIQTKFLHRKYGKFQLQLTKIR